MAEMVERETRENGDEFEDSDETERTVHITNENNQPILNINFGGKKDMENNEEKALAIHHSAESKKVKYLLRQREIMKPIPVDELKKLVREDDFIVDYYLSCVPGTSQGYADKFSEVIKDLAISSYVRPERPKEDDKAADWMADISLHLHRCKAFVMFITKSWLESSECEFDYMIAQRLSMTSSRPIMVPVLCEELELKDYPLMASVLPNLPLIDLSKSSEGGMEYLLAVTEFLVSPSLQRLPEWRRQREAMAFFASELMADAKEFDEKEFLPSGDYVGFFSDDRAFNSSRYDAGRRFLMRMSLKFDVVDANNNKDVDKDAAATFHGVGEDEVDVFSVDDGVISKDGVVNFVRNYADKLSYRVEMKGQVKNMFLSGTFSFEDSKKESGFWIAWPLRVYWKYRF